MNVLTTLQSEETYPKQKVSTPTENPTRPRMPPQPKFKAGPRMVGADAKAAYDRQQQAIQTDYYDLLCDAANGDQGRWVRLSLFDSSWDPVVGHQVVVPSEHLETSREYMELRTHMAVDTICLTDTSITTLRRYVQSISPKRLSRLPQYDLTLRSDEPEEEPVIAVCEAITWDFNSTLELYGLATALQDDHVRNLVMNHWRDKLRSESTYEVDKSGLDYIVSGLPADGPAIDFWDKAIPPGEGGQDILATMERDIEVKVGYVEEDDAEFHRNFHHCNRPEHEDGECSVEDHTVTEFDYTLHDFGAITLRTLLAFGLEEDDEDVPVVLDKLTRDLYAQYSNASTIVDDTAHPMLSISTACKCTFQLS